MKITRNQLTRLFAIAMALVMVAGISYSIALANEVQQAPVTTLDNLQAAYNGESNAHAKYLMSAEVADQEGYPQVASLFRAAARAEAIHARNHADVIQILGAEPVADVKTPDGLSTSELLASAVAGESYERDKMYPEFIAQARKEKNKDAIRTFNFAKAAEAEHAIFYQEALDNLDNWKDGPKVFYVCPVCGKTVTSLDFDKCPVCFTSADEYEQVN